MILLQLFWEFLKIGLFAVGGGMATLPFLQELAVRTGWYPETLITDMVAISESTPGPIGINMATYVGCNVAGIPGGVAASLGVVTPSVIIILLISKSLDRFRQAKAVEDAFYGLRPAVTGLIFAAGLSVARVAILRLSASQPITDAAALLDWRRLVLFAAAFLGIRKLKWHPVVFIAISAAVGILLAF